MSPTLPTADAYRKIFECSPSLLLLLDPDFLIAGATDAYLQATLTERSAVVGRSLFEVFPDNPDDPGATGARNLRRSLETVLIEKQANRMAVQKYDIRRPDGTFEVRYWNPINAPVLNDNGDVVWIIHRVEDVTDLTRLEDERTNLAEELHQRLAELEKVNRALLASEKAAAEASAFKSEFLSRMSHELRTPLNAILGFAQLIQLKHPDPDLREPVASISKAGRHLLTLINEILDLTKIEAGKMTMSLEPVPVVSTLEGALDLIRPIAESAEISLEVEMETCEELHVRADRQRLTQVLINLLNNAVKYNRPQGSVKVYCSDETPGAICIKIRDTGAGISEKDQMRLFQPFQRFGSPTVEGTGLGLALSQRYVGLMGGRLYLAESDPEGSTFAVELPSVEAPYSRVEEGRELGPLPENHASPSRKILYIEDNLSNMRLLELLFSDWPDLKLIPAMLGRLGIDLAHEHCPDVILLDLHLPDIGGEEVLAQLKSSSATRDIPVLILSADATPSQVRRLQDQGAADYFTKPIDLTTFMASLQMYLNFEEGGADSA